MVDLFISTPFERKTPKKNWLLVHKQWNGFREYEELTLSELYELLKLRASVFVVEQDCPYQDLDGKDSRATHLLGYQKNKLIAYSRIFRPGAFEKKHARIGRVVTQKQEEGRV